MKLTMDSDSDALYLRLNDAEIADSAQVAPGVVLDYDSEDNVVGVEMLHLSKRVAQADLQRVLLETLPLAAADVRMREERTPYGSEST
jgi:uncharacterized protein YuzE